MKIAMPFHSHINYDCFQVIPAELSSCDRLYGMQTLKYFLSGSLPKKFVDFWSEAVPQMTTDAVDRSTVI